MLISIIVNLFEATGYDLNIFVSSNSLVLLFCFLKYKWCREIMMGKTVDA